MPTVTLSRDGLSLNGRPFYLLSGQIHYFRFPRAEWPDILRQARAAGLNTIDTVIPWNLHEPAPGRFNFEELADLPGYIDLCAELGLYFIARPCPYICAEWENGGLPAWLANEPGIAYRLDNPAYLAATRRWFDTLLPLIVERQFDRGGPVILVQIENEHWASGVYGHDAHQETLAQDLRERGVTMPLYTCMGAGGDWPEFRNGWAGIDQKLLATRQVWPDNPMIVSELWSGWFDNWGASRHTGKSAASLDQRLHELTAIGAPGFSHWMWAGGTNFAFWGGRTVGGDTIHMTTSYDYDAPVSEYGGLTEKYFMARRHHLFLGTLGATLAPLLAGAKAGGPQVLTARAVAGRAAGGGAILRNVQNGDFTATFLRNDTGERQSYQLFTTADCRLPTADSVGFSAAVERLTIEVEAASIKPIFTHLPLADSGLILLSHTGRILGFWDAAGRKTLIVYGFEGETGQLALSGGDWQIVNPDGTDCHLTADTLHLRYWLTDRPIVVQTNLQPSNLPTSNLPTFQPFTLILLTQARAERCWPAGEAGFVVGPHYLYSHHTSETGHLALELDRRGVSPFYWLGSDGTRQIIPVSTPPAQVNPPLLETWEPLAVQELADEAQWQPLDRPQPFEALGCNLGYGWYRAVLPATFPPSNPPTLAAPGLNDRAHLFVDGDYAGTLGVGPDGPTLALPLALPPGPHDLRLLVDNLGRFNYGAGLGERKGLTDTLYWGGQQEDLTRGWTALWQEATFAGEAIANAKPAHVRPDAENVDLSAFPFSGPDVWLLREFHVPPGRRALLYFTGDRNPGGLYINGQNIIRFSRHYGGGFFKYDVSDKLNPDGQNFIALYIRDYAGFPWRAWLLTYDPAQPIEAEWSFRAGVTPDDRRPPTADRRPPTHNSYRQGIPLGPFTIHHSPFTIFFRTRFPYHPDTYGPGPFKLSLHGLRKGQLWLNGHNLGRYWQIGPQEFYKVPVSWLQAENELLIFEEAGGLPEEVRLWVDELGAGQAAIIRGSNFLP